MYVVEGSQKEALLSFPMRPWALTSSLLTPGALTLAKEGSHLRED